MRIIPTIISALLFQMGISTSAWAACTPPTGVAVIELKAYRVGLQWDLQSDSSVSGFKIYRSTTSTFVLDPSTLIGQAPGNHNIAYYDSSVATSTRYYYRITATCVAGGESGGSTPSVMAITPPIAPYFNSAPTTPDGTVVLSWTNYDPRTDQYKVYRSTTPSSNILIDSVYQGAVTSPSYTDTNVIGGTRYYYQVTALYSGSASFGSNIVSAVPTFPPIPTVSGLAASSVMSSQVHLSWDPVTYPSVKSYRVYRSTTSGFSVSPSTLIGTSANDFYTDPNCTSGTTYYYRVTFVNSVTGEVGAPSNEASTPSSESITYTYDGTAGPHALTSAGPRSFGYDENGNLVERTQSGQPRACFSYILSNKLSQVSNGASCESKISNYGYDMDGNRIFKVKNPGAGEQVTRFYGAIEDENGSERFFYSAGGMRIAERSATGLFFYHGDHLGSSSVITRADGTRNSDITYYPFGAVKTKATFGGSPTLARPDIKKLYNDKHWDAETDLYDYGARYYDSTLGRFTTADTIVPDPMDPQSLNRYSYVKNNPMRYIDPTGHFDVEAAIKLSSQIKANPQVFHALLIDAGEQYAMRPQRLLGYMDDNEHGVLNSLDRASRITNYDGGALAAAAFQEGLVRTLRNWDLREYFSNGTSGPMGMDRFVESMDSLEKAGYLPHNFQGFEADGEVFRNEKGDVFLTGTFKDLDSLLIGFGAMMAESRDRFMKDAQRMGMEVPSNAALRNAWSYLYYNCGFGCGYKTLKENGVHFLLGNGKPMKDAPCGGTICNDKRENAQRVGATTEFFDLSDIFGQMSPNLTSRP